MTALLFSGDGDGDLLFHGVYIIIRKFLLKRKPPESRQTQGGPLGYRGDAFLGTSILTRFFCSAMLRAVSSTLPRLFIASCAEPTQDLLCLSA